MYSKRKIKIKRLHKKNTDKLSIFNHSPHDLENRAAKRA
jgi:hypothetical protein